MKKSLLLLAAAVMLPSMPTWAGDSASTGKDVAKGGPAPAAKRSLFPEDPAGLLTAGLLFSDHNTGAFVDNLAALYATQDRNSFLFFNSRYTYEDQGQLLSGTGLGFRQRIPGQDVLFGLNAYYDTIGSYRDNDFTQFGLGAEVLTRWVDARANYYLPDNKGYETDRYPSSGRTARRFESGLEGLNAELGFLIPGLDKYAEVRVFGGYYHYNNPFNKDYDGFTGRLEARLLPGLIADVEYFQDSAFNGGHWTAGLRASVPFNLLNVLRGRNPFEGAADYFRPRSRDFSERMSEMVIRSTHRIETAVSDKTTARLKFD